MDLNYLYLREQVSLFRSEHAACPRARKTHGRFAAAYADRILRFRNARRAEASA